MTTGDYGLRNIYDIISLKNINIIFLPCDMTNYLNSLYKLICMQKSEKKKHKLNR